MLTMEQLAALTRGRSLDGLAVKSKTPPTAPPPEEKRRRRRWTLSERVGRRFVNLVEKYIRSLSNSEYMQTAPLFHILAYYAVFQRIVWLLLQHNVIDGETFVRLAAEINLGFFGISDEQPPIANPARARYVQRLWLENWRQAEVHPHAFASVIAIEDRLHRLADMESRTLLRMHNLRAICAVSWRNRGKPARQPAPCFVRDRSFMRGSIPKRRFDCGRRSRWQKGWAMTDLAADARNCSALPSSLCSRSTEGSTFSLGRR